MGASLLTLCLAPSCAPTLSGLQDPSARDCVTVRNPDGAPARCCGPPAEVVTTKVRQEADVSLLAIKHAIRSGMTIEAQYKKVRPTLRSLQVFEVVEFRLCLARANGAISPEDYTEIVKGLLQPALTELRDSADTTAVRSEMFRHVSGISRDYIFHLGDVRSAFSRHALRAINDRRSAAVLRGSIEAYNLVFEELFAERDANVRDVRRFWGDAQAESINSVFTEIDRGHERLILNDLNAVNMKLRTAHDGKSQERAALIPAITVRVDSVLTDIGTFEQRITTMLDASLALLK